MWPKRPVRKLMPRCGGICPGTLNNQWCPGPGPRGSKADVGGAWSRARKVATSALPSPTMRTSKTSPRASAASKVKSPASASQKPSGATAPAAARKRTRKSATNVAIATELAPAVAIALLDKSQLAPGAPPAALDCLAAGVSASQTRGKVRVQLMFDNGTVLPVEMSIAAGEALSNGLSEELPAPK